MDETTFEFEAAQLAEASRRFPAHRRKVPPSRIQTSTSAISARHRAPSSAGTPGTRAVTSEVSPSRTNATVDDGGVRVPGRLSA